jgi:hypothetical protein
VSIILRASDEPWNCAGSSPSFFLDATLESAPAAAPMACATALERRRGFSSPFSAPSAAPSSSASAVLEPRFAALATLAS